MAGAQHTGIEQVPPLQQYKNGEEYRLCLAWRETIADGYENGMNLYQPTKNTQQQEEEKAYEGNAPLHAAIDDKSMLTERLLPHHLPTRWQRSQSHCCKGVHDEVYPKNLGNRQGQLCANNGTKEHQQQSA